MKKMKNNVCISNYHLVFKEKNGKIILGDFLQSKEEKIKKQKEVEIEKAWIKANLDGVVVDQVKIQTNFDKKTINFVVNENDYPNYRMFARGNFCIYFSSKNYGRIEAIDRARNLAKEFSSVELEFVINGVLKKIWPIKQDNG